MSFLKEILNPDVQRFINNNEKEYIAQLLLKKSPFQGISMQEIAWQIQGRKIATKKFPFLLQENIIFPPHLNLEQASAQEIAQNKAEKINGKSLLDLTCGFGIDAYFLSEKFVEITLVERNKQLLEIVEHNWKTLGKKAVFIHDDLENFLSNDEKNYDVIYLDPARRDLHKNKKFLLEDLSPNILEISDLLLSKAKKVLIKLSPLIDLKYLLKILPCIEKIEIIALRNEVKEVLISLTPNFIGETEIIAKNLGSSDVDFSFLMNEEDAAQADFSDVLEYLYFPNHAVLKAGAFRLIAQRFELKKLHTNTHLYTASEYREGFCGRVFRVKEISAKHLKKGDKFNIIAKNYPLKPEEIKKKYQLQDGGADYLIFTQSLKGKIILLGEKI